MTASTSTRVDLTGEPAAPSTDPPADVLQLIYPGHQEPQVLAGNRYESAVVQPLMTAFSVVQHHWEAITAARGRGRVIVVAPASAALGDPDRPLDAAVVGGLISFVRSVAIELQRHGATAHILFFDETPDDPAVQAMIDTLVADVSGTVTGQEIYLAGGAALGRAHP
ncbi:MAG: hypothetical protein ABW137_28225 [Mycobacterium sp.]